MHRVLRLGFRHGVLGRKLRLRFVASRCRATIPMSLLQPHEFFDKWSGCHAPSAPRPRSTSPTCAGCSASRLPTTRTRPVRTTRSRRARERPPGRRWLRRRVEAGLLRVGVQGQAQGSRRRLHNCSSTARRSRTLRCWSCATSSASRSTPTSRGRPRRSTRSTSAASARRRASPCESCAPCFRTQTNCAGRHAARDHGKGRGALRAARPAPA